MSTRTTLARAAALAAVLVAFVAAPAGAQEFRGDVTDEFGTPLEGVRIGLFDLEGEMVADSVSGPDGVFAIRAPADGEYRIHFTRPGFRSVSGGPYELRAKDVALDALVVMHRAPEELPGLDVEVEGVYPRLVTSGFYERRQKGFGYFLDRDQIERRGQVRMSDLLDPIPNVFSGQRADIGAGGVVNPAVWVGRGGRRCTPALWIDGLLIRNGGLFADPLRPDDFVWPADAEGIELYVGPAQVPPEFSRSAGCGVLVVWTRSPGARGGGAR
jgi:hypothetical protein